MMNERAETREPLVLLQGETRYQDFKSDLRAEVSELSTVEIEAYSALRTVLYALEPEKSGLRVDEPPDEPRRCDAIYPKVLACGPGTAAICLGIAVPDLTRCRMWLIG